MCSVNFHLVGRFGSSIGYTYESLFKSPPLLLGRLRAPAEGKSHSRSVVGAHGLPATSSQDPELPSNPAWDSNLPSLWRYDSSQDNRGMRGIESAYVSIFIVFIQLFELEYIGDLQVSGWVFLFVCLIHSHLIHSRTVAFQGLVLHRLWQKEEYHS